MSNSTVPRLSQVAGQFLDHARVEWQFRPQTIEKYEYCLRRMGAAWADPPVTGISASDITSFKAQMLSRGNGCAGKCA